MPSTLQVHLLQVGDVTTGGQLFDMPWLLALSRVSAGALCFLTSEMGRAVPLIMCVNVWPHRMNSR